MKAIPETYLTVDWSSLSPEIAGDRPFIDQELGRPLEYYVDRVDALGIAGFDRVLDAGCGIGQWTLALARKNRRVVGVDINANRLAVAAHLQARSRASNVEFNRESLSDLSFPDRTFDAVFCYDVLMLTHRPARAIAELGRVLRTGGKLFACVNDVGWSILLMTARMARDRRPDFVGIGARTILRTWLSRRGPRYLSTSWMMRQLRSCGLKVIDHGGEGRLGRPGSSMRPPVYPGRFAGIPCVREYLAEKLAPSPPHAGLAPNPTDLSDRGKRPDDPWFQVPGDITRVEKTYYPRSLLREGRAAVGGTDPGLYLRSLLDALTQGAAGPQEVIERIICFIQDALRHSPLRQPMEGGEIVDDARLLLHLSEGRCGHAAAAAAQLFRAAGFRARVSQLHSHVIAEVHFGGTWRIADADAFKNGVIPKTSDGGLLSMEELRAAPHLIDRFPPTGLVWRTGTRYGRNAAGLPVEGHVDLWDFEDKGFLCSHYLPVPRQFPPALPRLLRPRVVLSKPGLARLEWEASRDRDGDLLHYEARVGTTSKGWSYDRVVYENLLNETGADVGAIRTSAPSVEVKLPRPGRYFWSVKAVDRHVEIEPRTHFWSSDEGEVLVEEGG